ncbi:hypothetical protein [Micromonospora sp. URMC 103]|uniref:hypothetical protein n=1 Tax=Micromonospora sp. URMC 103 TaxID=3423406 RepID=UPI003F1A5344
MIGGVLGAWALCDAVDGDRASAAPPCRSCPVDDLLTRATALVGVSGPGDLGTERAVDPATPRDPRTTDTSPDHRPGTDTSPDRRAETDVRRPSRPPVRGVAPPPAGTPRPATPVVEAVDAALEAGLGTVVKTAEPVVTAVVAVVRQPVTSTVEAVVRPVTDPLTDVLAPVRPVPDGPDPVPDEQDPVPDGQDPVIDPPASPAAPPAGSGHPAATGPAHLPVPSPPDDTPRAVPAAQHVTASAAPSAPRWKTPPSRDRSTVAATAAPAGGHPERSLHRDLIPSGDESTAGAGHAGGTDLADDAAAYVGAPPQPSEIRPVTAVDTPPARPGRPGTRPA